MKDFFISYNSGDKQWAEWIAWTLEEAGYSVVIQAWDFRPGGNFILDMQRAAVECQKTIAVLSETYLTSAYTQPEWTSAFASDPQSLARKLIPVRVRKCKPPGMLRPLVYVDLVDVPEVEAKQRLLDALKDRVKPEVKPNFPGDIESVAIPSSVPVPFPQPVECQNPQPPQQVTNVFYGPVGSVGNEGTQTNVAGTAGNQIGRFPTLSVVSRLQMPAQLSIAEAKQFCAALIAAFPEKPLLEQMVKRGLGIKLNLITQGNLNYELTVDKLVEWAESEGRLQELLEAAVQRNPGNLKLKELSNLWLPSS